MRKYIIHGLLILFILGFSEGASGQRKINILYLGNSLTYYNNLPELVKIIGSCDSIAISYRSLSSPNYALEDHWNDGQAEKEIQSGTYDFVVVQQGPSSQKEGRDLLVTYALKFSSLCKNNGARIVVYMVWPSQQRSGDFHDVYVTYRTAADSTKGIFCPAGNAWLAAWKKYPDLKLYGEDNFHPNYNGSLLAALMIYGTIMKKQKLGFVDYQKVKKNDLSKEDLNILIRAAEQTLKENKRGN